MDLSDDLFYTDSVRHVLVVDDEFINREMLRVMLEPEYDVEVAENGEQALSILNSNPRAYACVLLDLAMPVMDGRTALRRMQEDRLLSKIPVIVLTAEKSAEAESLRMGASDFITKPYSAPEVIRARVSKTIELSEAASVIAASEIDPVTGLCNRRKYERDLVELQKSEHESITLITVDVNGLKDVNDSMGHAAGDELIRGAAQCLQKAFGDAGTCYRVGGDEFMALIIDQPTDKNELRASLKTAASEWQGSIQVELTVSVGISVSDSRKRKSLERLAAEADMEMYADKRRHYSRRGNDRRSRDDRANRNVEISKSELSIRLSELETVFDEVRIVDVDEKRAVVFDGDGGRRLDTLHCFEIWGKGEPCENCISAKALADHGKHTKIEVRDGVVCIVTSQYVYVDGSPGLIEMIRKLDDLSTFVEPVRGAFEELLKDGASS